ncbi:MAG: ribosome maturation factor RimM [Cupriavidus sp.]|nr:ribosome maturation factor RimM [Cupriavidus sp.]
MTGNASGRKPLNLAATQGGASGRQSTLPAALSFTDSLPDDLVEVGYVGAAYGIRGWIKVQPHADDASALLHARRWWLLRAPPAGVVSAPAQPADAVSVKISQSREHSGTVVAQPAGVSDRNMAELLRGRRVWIRRADFPVPEEGEFYWVDLIGCAVVNEQGEALGDVTGLIDNGAHQILQVAYELPDGKAAERLIPFVDAFLRAVDTSARRIVVDWGLDY